MMNEELRKMNRSIEEARRNRQRALEDAMRKRGWRRRVSLWFARLFHRIHDWEVSLRDQILRGDDYD
jgi:hypothetical protein